MPYDTVALLRAVNINFVRNEYNPFNVSQLRSIEKFGILSKVYNGDWTTETDHQPKLWIQKCLQELDWEVVLGMTSIVKKNLRNAAVTYLSERKYF